MQDLKKISEYCELHSTQPIDILQELERETHLKTLAPQMLSGRLQGVFLSMISSWLRPLTVLEIGTFTGYGTINLAKGLKEKGVVHTVDVNPELSYISQKYFKKAGLEGKIIQHIGDAKDIIPTITELFDLVYIDAGKNDYNLHYDLVIGKMNTGGVILADNVLWSGKVGAGLKDKDTSVLEAFNQKVLADDRVNNIILPIRDGLMIAQKK